MERVLLLEDDKVDAESFSRVAEKLGVTVDVATTLEEAKMLLQQKRHRIVFFDCNLPDASLTDVVGWVRTLKAKVITAVAWTAMGQPSTALILGEVGAPWLIKGGTREEHLDFAINWAKGRRMCLSNVAIELEEITRILREEGSG